MFRECELRARVEDPRVNLPLELARESSPRLSIDILCKAPGPVCCVLKSLGRGDRVLLKIGVVSTRNTVVFRHDLATVHLRRRFRLSSKREEMNGYNKLAR